MDDFHNSNWYLIKTFGLDTVKDILQAFSFSELQENILIHVRNIFFESTLDMKCEIIKSLQKLITNLVRVNIVFFYKRFY